ncbi:MAG: beta-lactamase family protein [Anaerolineales bacterium]|nr:beta-lactamase family protein [Anaerolineales bacterium]
MSAKCFRSMMAAACLLLAAAAAETARAVRAPAPQPPGGWQEFFDRVLPKQLESLHIPGAVVAVVEGEELAFARGYGFADAENRIEPDPEKTLFRIGSITKLFTWTAVMQLAEQGKLDLDADVNDYLDFRIPDTYPQPVTLRHLMAHTAGFEDRVAAYMAASPQDLVPLGEWLAANVPARVRAPGEISSYSNYGAALAGYIVERVSGTPFDDYLEENIFAPLGMDHTTSRQPPPQSWSADLSKGYVWSGGRFAALDFEYMMPSPTGSISSTATDIARFMSAHLQGGEFRGARILRDTTAELMHRRLFGVDPRLNGLAYGFYEMSRNGLRVIGHEGDTRLFHSLLAIIPEKNLGVFVAFNGENAFNVQYLLRKEFLDMFFPSAESAPERLTLSSGELAKFAGSYRQTRRFAETTVEKAGTLLEPIIVQATDDGALRISSAWYGVYRFVAVEPLVFIQEDDPHSLLLFRTDADGNVTQAFVGEDPLTAWEKLPWYADYTLHYMILILGLLLFLCALAAALVRGIVQRFRKPAVPAKGPAAAGGWIFNLLSLIGILFPVGFVFGFGGISYGQTGLLTAVLALPILFIGLWLAAGFFLFRAWREKFWPAAGRIFYSLLFFVSAAYLWSLSCWNLIGWRY